MQIKILENYDIDLYNDCAINPLQSWQWGLAREKMGIKIIRYGVFDNENLIDIYQMSLHKIPKINFYIGYIPRSRIPSEEIVNFIGQDAKKYNCIFVKFEPYELYDENSIEKINKLQNKLPLKRSNHQLFTDWTMSLPLKEDENTLLQQCKSKTRYNIRLAQKKGVIVKEISNNEGFDIFSKLYFETCSRQKYAGHNTEYHKIIWDTLKNDFAHILIAFYNDEPLASYELFKFKNTLYYPYGGSSLAHRNLMGANALMWETIRFGKQKNCDNFDMWGASDPNNNDNHHDDYGGFTKFKEGYNALYTHYIGSYDLVLNKTLYEIYGIIFQVRKVVLKGYGRS